MNDKKLTFVEYMLTKGHSEMVKRHEVFGKGISPYLIKAAYTDQFCNCKLKSVCQIDAGELVARVTETSDLEKLISNSLIELLEFYEDTEALRLLHLEMIKSKPNQGIAIPSNLANEKDELTTICEPVFEVPEEVKKENYALFSDNKFAIEQKLQLEALKQKNKIIFDGVEIQEAYKRVHSFINRGLIDVLYRNRYGKSIRYTKELYIRSSIHQASIKAKPALIRRELSKNEKSKIKLLTRTYKDLETVRQRFLNQIKKDENRPIGIHLIDKATERMVCKILTVLRKEDHFIRNNIFSLMRSLTFKYDTKGNLTFLGNCKDETNRRLVILRELKKLFVKTRRTTQVKSKDNTNRMEVELFESEKPLEKDGLRLFEF